MKTYRKIGLALFSALALLAATATLAYASTPNLTVSNVGGTSVQVKVTNADPSASVFLYYTPSAGGAMQFQVLGGTDSSGSFTTVVNSSSYSIAPGGSSYVTVDNQQSPVVSWPSNASGTSNSTLTLSQSSVSLAAGQTTSVSAYGGTGSVYVSSNSNASVAGISVSGSSVTVSGINAGSTVVTFCSTSNSSYCATLTVAVGGTSSSVLSFSTSNVFLSTGQNQTVNIYGGSQYTMSSNSNPNVVSTTLNGGALTLYAVGTGSATVSICQTGGSCGTVYVTVNGGSSSGSITFSQTSPTISASQSTAVTVYGGSGTYYISSNSNPSAVGINLAGSILTLTGNTVNSSSAVIICSSASACGTLNVTVGNSNSPITFSQSNVVVNANQSSAVNIYGSSGYYISGSQASSAASAAVSGSSLIISGLNPGAASFTVCGTGGSCGQVSVQVNSAGSTSSGSGSGITLGQISFSIPAGGTSLFSMNGSSSYSISSNSNPSIASVSINGTALNISAISAGTDAATICQSGGACVPLVVIVTQPLVVSNGGGVATTPIPPAPSSSSSGYKFNNPLDFGSTGADVTALQQRLIQLGYLNASATGYYGSATLAAVKRFQSANGISAQGNVGPATRAALNNQ